MKRCTSKKCTQTNPQPLDNFQKNKTTKDGFQAFCKSCRRAFDILNKDKIKIQKAKWQKDNADKVKEANDRWSKKNRDKVNARYRRWKNKNPEDYKIAKKKWENNNSDKVKAQKARGYQKNRKETLKMLNG